eukprot:TRINITY_DN32757_c0_g1_i1.p1 TRINITY_DN32757_c0_g1~~TRINITY_DN32757_c0_g1_i1.p1  ORF type:complete len:249 (-),score=79.66 TRINITY_DN32757_c0_g1_i1:102-848(-)
MSDYIMNDSVPSFYEVAMDFPSAKDIDSSAPFEQYSEQPWWADSLDTDAYVDSVVPLPEHIALVPQGPSTADLHPAPAVPSTYPKTSASTSDVINYVVSRLDAMMESTGISPDDPAYAAFANEPQVPMGTYIKRMTKLVKIAKEDVLLALIYLERLLKNNPALQVTNLNCHRLFLVSAMLATKFLHDIPLSNKYWAQVSGTFTLPQMNKMEGEFLALLKFDLNADNATWASYIAEVERLAAANKCAQQ